MVPIYLELIERVENGEGFRVDFEKRTMKVGKDYLIKKSDLGIFQKIHSLLCKKWDMNFLSKITFCLI